MLTGTCCRPPLPSGPSNPTVRRFRPVSPGNVGLGGARLIGAEALKNAGYFEPATGSRLVQRRSQTDNVNERDEMAIALMVSLQSMHEQFTGVPALNGGNLFSIQFEHASHRSGDRAAVRQFVIDTFLLGDASHMHSDDESFLETGTIDSTGVLEVILFLETRLESRLRIGN